MRPRPSIPSFLLIALATAVAGPGRAPGQSVTMEDLQDWSFYNNTGWAYLRRGDLPRAEKRFHEACEIAYPLAAHHPELLARSYTDLALVLLQEGRAAEADPLASWALGVREARRGKASEQVAQTLHVLALVADAQAQFPRAEALLSRSLAIYEKRQGPSSARVALVLNDLATLYSYQRKYDQAESLFHRILEMPARTIPPNAPDRATALIGLASIYTARGEFTKAEALDQKLLNFLEQLPASGYVTVAGAMGPYLTRLRLLGHSSEAESLEAAARAARGNPDGAASALPPPPNDPRRAPAPPRLRPRAT